MTVVKTLDKGPFFWHEYEQGTYVREHPKHDWCLPYEPVYILTNELNVSAQIFALKDIDPMTVDIINEHSYGEDSLWLNCSIDKRLMTKLNL